MKQRLVVDFAELLSESGNVSKRRGHMQTCCEGFADLEKPSDNLSLAVLSGLLFPQIERVFLKRHCRPSGQTKRVNLMQY